MECSKRRKVSKTGAECSLIPHINIRTILDLDLLAILSNHKLRHEIINSKSLQFKSLNKEHSHKNNAYWRAIDQELRSGCVCGVRDCHCTRRLPILIRNIRDILVNLLESSNKKDSLFVHNLIDPIVILDNLSNNALNLHDLFSVVGQVLKKHCAPIRDAEIEQFIATSIHDTTKSLEMFLQLLEVMKIDILNHQLIAHRPLILQSAVEIEFQTFETMRVTGEVSVEGTKEWLLRAKKCSDAESTVKQIFITATQQLIESYTTSSSIPETFQLDCHKFEQSHQYIDDLTLISLLLLLARQTLAGFSASGASPLAAKSIPQYTNNELQQLKAELYVILNDGQLPSPQVKQVVVSDNNGKLIHHNVVDLVSASANNNSGDGILLHKHQHSITMALVHISHSVQSKLGIEDSGPADALVERLREWHAYHYDGKSSVYQLLKKRLYDNLKQYLMIVGNALTHNTLNDPCFVDVATIGRRLANIVDFNYRVHEALYATMLSSQSSTLHYHSSTHTITHHQHQSQADRDTAAEQKRKQELALQLAQNHTIPT